MLLLTVTCPAACCCVSNCTKFSIVKLDSAKRCATHVSGKVSVELCPCNRLASSATNALSKAVTLRAISATSKIKLAGFDSAASIILSAQPSASLRLARLAAILTAERLRFSISAKRSIIGIAHNSPNVSAATR